MNNRRMLALMLFILGSFALISVIAYSFESVEMSVSPESPSVGEEIIINISSNGSINSSTTLLEVITPSSRLRLLQSGEEFENSVIFRAIEPGEHKFQLFDRILRTILGETTITVLPSNESTNDTENLIVETPTLLPPPVLNDTNASINETGNTTKYNITDDGNYTEELVQHKAIVGQPVMWTRRLNQKESRDGVISIPERAFQPRIRRLHALQEEYEVSFFTPPPIMSERELGRGKSVQITSDEHYQDVLAQTTLDENLGITDPDIVEVYWKEKGEFIDAQVLDTDGNGIYDTVEWTVPHLSTQNFEIIVIDQAEHLDENKEFIADIFDEVSELDSVWSGLIDDGEYVAVRFERKLFVKNDIRVYAQVLSGNPTVEIYPLGSNTSVAEIYPINDDSYSIALLSGMQNPQDIFYLRVVGGSLRIDHIVDPSVQYIVVRRGTSTLSAVATNFTINQTDTSRAFVRAYPRSGSSAPNDLTVTSTLVNSTALHLQKYGAGTADVSWEIIESPIFDVQRNTAPYGTSDSVVTVDITPLNMSRSFVIHNSRLNTATNSQFMQGLWVSRFVNASRIEFSRGATGTAGEISWQVVEVQGGTVDSGLTAMASSTASVDVTLNRTFNLSRSFVIRERSSSANGLAYREIQANLTDSTSLNLTRSDASAGNLQVSWYVVEHPFFLVQNYFRTSSGNSPQSQAITSVVRNETFHFRSFTSYTGTGNTNANARFTTEINETDNIYIQKGTNGQTQDVILQVVSVNVDDTPPSITINDPSALVYGPNQFPLLVNITLDSIGDSAHFSVDDWATNITLNTSDNLNFEGNMGLLSDGSYTLRLFANDTWGNSNESATYDFNVSSVPPRITIHDPQAQTYTSAFNLLLNVTSTDVNSLSSCWWNLDEGTNTTVTCNQTSLFNTSVGNHTLFYYSNDTLGNVNVSNVTFEVVDVSPPIITQLSPVDNGGSFERGLFIYSVTDASNVSNCSLYVNGTAVNTSTSITKDTAQNLSSTLSVGNHTWYIYCSDQGGYANSTPNRTVHIISTSYGTGNLNVTGLDVTNVSGFTVNTPGTGSIVFQEPVNLSGGIDIDSIVNISSNYVFINTTADSRLNRSATILMEGLGSVDPPIVYRDGALCDSICSGESYNSGNFTFNVSYFSSYTSGVNAQLEIFDDVEGSFASEDEMVGFHANYSNLTSGAPITGAECNITFDVAPTGPFTMTYNATSLLYEYNRTFSTNGLYVWNVSCDAATYEPLQTSDNISIAGLGNLTVNLFRPPNAGVTDVFQNMTFNIQATITCNGGPDATCGNVSSHALRNITVVSSTPNVTFNTSGTNTWTVPAGVTSITVKVWGAGGGGGGGSAGTGAAGAGAGHSTATLSVTPGETLNLSIGGGGGAGTGNAASGAGGGGGGYTAIFRGTRIQANLLVLAAGGGGGGGGDNGAGVNGGAGGEGGGDSGNQGTTGGGTTTGGGGGTRTSGGAVGTGDDTSGTGGTALQGGVGDAHDSGISGGAGGTNGGGAGGNAASGSRGGGGGGGGGYYGGGGGGGANAGSVANAGGGGGSSYTTGTDNRSWTGSGQNPANNTDPEYVGNAGSGGAGGTGSGNGQAGVDGLLFIQYSVYSSQNLIINTSADTPVHTVSSQPQYCVLDGGESCTLTWITNATGYLGERVLIHVNATSNYSLIPTNTSQSSEVNITIDEIAPTINSVAFNDTQVNQSDEVLLLVNVTDVHNVTMVNATILYPNGTSINYSVYYVSGDNYGLILTDTIQLGVYNVTDIYATDEATNTNHTQYTATGFEVLASPPSIFDLLSPANDTESTNRRPLARWEQTTDREFDNYTVQFSTDSGFSTINFANFTFSESSNSTLIGQLLADAIYYWRVIAYDIYGNSRTSNNTYIYITDNTAPAISLNRPINRLNSSQQTMLFNFTPSEANTLQNCTLYANFTGGWQANQTNSTPANGTFNYFTETLPDGEYIWNVLCVDQAGNQGFAPSNFTLSVDTVAPNVSLVGPANNTFNNTANNIDFFYNVTDAISETASCEFIIDGVSEQTSSPITEETTLTFFSFLTNGQHNWSINCTDFAGNEGASNTYNITVQSPDTDPPVILLNYPANDQYVPTSTIAFNFTPQDASNISNCTVVLDGVLNQTNTTYMAANEKNNISVSGITEGMHNWSITCFDEGGFQGNSSTRNFTVDLTNPVVVLNDPTEGELVSSTVIFNYTPTDTYLDNCTLYGNWTGTWQAEQTNSTPTSGQYDLFEEVLSDGNYIWNVICQDFSGRQGNGSNRTFTVDTTPPNVVSITPINDSGDSDGVVTFDFTASDINGINNCSLLINNTINVTNSSVTQSSNYFTVPLQVASYDWQILCFDNNQNQNSSENRRIGIVILDGFDGSTTDISGISISSITNFVLEQSPYGIINYTSIVDLHYGANLTQAVDISFNTTYLNPLQAPTLDLSANITHHNITFIETPVIFRDGSLCPSSDCSVRSYVNNNLTFNVTGFSNYTARANAQLEIFDTGDSQVVEPNETIRFYANYTNITTNQPITGAICNVTFGTTPTGPFRMTYNATSLLYEYNRTFVSPGTYNWNVFCNGSSTGHEPLNVSDDIFVSLSPRINVTLITPPTTGIVDIYQNKTYSVNARVACTGSGDFTCGNVTVLARYNATQSLIPPTYVNSTEATTGGTQQNTLTINVPGGIEPDDVIIAVVSNSEEEDAGTQISPGQAGWTFVISEDVQNAVSQPNASVWYRIADGTEPSTYTWNTAGTTTGIVAQLLVYRDAGNITASPISQTATLDDGGVDGCPIAPSVTTQVANETVLYIGFMDDDEIPATESSYYPAGTTGRQATEASSGGDGLDVGLGTAEEIRASPGATGTRSFQNCVAIDEWAGITISLRPSLPENPWLPIPTSSVDPFYSLSPQPQYCVLDIGESCDIYWSVNVTGELGSRHLININGTSNYTENVTNGESDNATVNITIDDLAPVINSAALNTSIINQSDTVLLTVNVTEDHVLVHVNATILHSNGTYQNVTLTNSTGGDLFVYVFNYTTNLGVYNITFIHATDAANNINENSTSLFFNVTPSPPLIFNLLTPANDTVSTDTTPSLTWEATSDPHFRNYTILFDTDPSFASPDFTFNTTNVVTNNSLTIYQPLSSNQQYYWIVTASDIFNNLRNSTNYFEYTTDNIAPAVVLNYPTEGLFIGQSQVTFNYTITDTNLDNCTLYGNWSGTWEANQTNSSPTSGTHNYFTETLPDGQYIWNVLCYDRASTSSFATNNITFTVDTTPPVVQLINPLNNTYNDSTNNIFFTYNVTDTHGSVASCEIIVNDTVRDTDSTITEDVNQQFVIVVVNGEYNWSVNCTDNTGNEGASVEHNLTINSPDNDPPVILLNFPEENDYLSYTNISFNYTPDDVSDIVLCNITIDGVFNQTNQTFINKSIPNYINISNFTEGLHNWSISCIDNRSNPQGNSTTENFTVDLTNPTVVLNTPGDSNFVAVSDVVFNYTPTDLYLDNCTLFTNSSGSWAATQTNSTPATATENFFTQNLNDGSYLWNVVCFDFSGRSGTGSSNRTVNVDTRAPLYYNETATPASPFVYDPLQNYQFNITWDEPFGPHTVTFESNFTGSLANQTVFSSDSRIYSLTTSGLAVGVYRYRWYANDTLGQENVTSIFTYQVTRAQGVVNLTLNGTDGNMVITDTSLVNITGFTITPNNGILEIFLDGVPIASGVSPLQNLSIISTAGAHNVTLIRNESQNHTEARETHFIIAQDSTPPIVSLVAPPNNTYWNTSFIVDYIFNVTDSDSTVDSCSLIIDGVIVKTDSSITEGINQTISYQTSNGQHNWSINCTTIFNATGASQTYNITLNVSSTGAFLTQPDAGAPGMNLFIQIVGDNFVAGQTDVTVNTTDIVVGPSILTDTEGNVSAGGRVIQTIFYISEDASPQDVQVSVNGEALTRIFTIVTPTTNSGNFSGLSGSFLIGDGSNGTRTFGGTIVLDTLFIPAGVTVAIDTTDPDGNASNGNQGYLPAIVLVDGPVDIQGTLNVSGVRGTDSAEGSTGGAGGAGGPGGGGGGAGGSMTDANAQDGGNGFTGGGGGSDSSAGGTGDGGNGSGSLGASSSGGTAGTGGSGLLGTIDTGGQGGSTAGTGGSAGAGGSGYPFGTQATASPALNAPGGTGGASGAGLSSGACGGGGGGFGTTGANATCSADPGETEPGQGGNRSGNLHLLPLSGGSGASGGSPDQDGSGRQAGGGGGGGGSMLLFATENITVSGTFVSQGGDGGDGTAARHAAGGGGSGGGLLLQAPNVSITGTVDITGGAAGDSSCTVCGPGGAGGEGRVRVDGLSSGTDIPGGASSEYAGPAILLVNSTHVRGRGGANTGITVVHQNRSGNRVSFNDTTDASGDFLINISHFVDLNYISVSQNTSNNTRGVFSSAATWIYDNLPPNVTLLTPQNNSEFNYSTINFTYRPWDHYLNNCSLYINSTGVWSANQTNTTPTNNATNNFLLSLDDGDYLWNIQCTDTTGNSAFATNNRTLRVDTTPPNIVLNTPVNETNVTGLIIFNWTVSDNLATNMTCSITIDGQVNQTGIVVGNGQFTTVNLTLSQDSEILWNVTCVDELNNSNISLTYSFFNLIAPVGLEVDMIDQNERINFTWSPVSVATSYYVYISNNYSSFASTPNATITGTNFTDDTAYGLQQRYYRVSSARGQINATSTSTVGKYRRYIPTNLSLISFPLSPSSFILDNESIDGFRFRTVPELCINSLWEWNGTGYLRTDWNGSSFTPAGGSSTQFRAINQTLSYWFETNTTCNLTFVGTVPLVNITIDTPSGANFVGWHTIFNLTLPQDSDPPVIITDPTSNIQAIDRYNSLTNSFEVTIHYLIGGTPWGWFPSFNNQDFLTLDPTKGYVFDAITTGNWTFDPLT